MEESQLAKCTDPVGQDPVREPTGASSATDALIGDDCPKCGVCEEEVSKYKCPSCGIRTCSLGCVKGHKASTGCTGKRSRGEYVKLSEFGEKQLLSDVGFLQEVGRENESALRRRPRPAPYHLPYRLQTLCREAKRRKVHLEIQTPGMHKRELNRSRYDPSKQRLLWHVEWHFVSGNLRIHDREVPEGEVLSEVLSRHLFGGRRGFKDDEKLLPYAEAGLKGLTLAMRPERCQIHRVRYHRLDPSGTLASQLEGRRVVEFPTLLVLLPEELSNYRFDDQASGSGNEGEGESSEEEDSSSSGEDDSSSGSEDEQEEAPTGQAAQ